MPRRRTEIEIRVSCEPWKILSLSDFRAGNGYIVRFPESKRVVISAG